MTKVINFYGGPSAGKSTMAAQLFGEMKTRRMNVEYVPEFAKDLTWKKSGCLDDQVYVFANQHHALYTLLGQVDYIITDSPLLLGLHYVEMGFQKFERDVGYLRLIESLEELVLRTFHRYNNINFYVERGDRKFIQAGRNQNEEESKSIDDAVFRLLSKHFIPFKRVGNIHDVLVTLELEKEVA